MCSCSAISILHGLNAKTRELHKYMAGRRSHRNDSALKQRSLSGQNMLLQLPLLLHLLCCYCCCCCCCCYCCCCCCCCCCNCCCCCCNCCCCCFSDARVVGTRGLCKGQMYGRWNLSIDDLVWYTTYADQTCLDSHVPHTRRDRFHKHDTQVPNTRSEK